MEILRQELDDILIFIAEATLTDTEWEWASAFLGALPFINPKDKYQALSKILNDRGGEGDGIAKLTGYFVAKGYVDIDPEQAKKNYNNISLGTPL